MNNLSNADVNIIKTFNNNFGMLKPEPIVLYGIGDKTRLILENINGYNIVGLMDKSTTSRKIYGKKILSPDEVIGITKTIVIVSNFASSHLIYRRISNLEEQHGINIFHLNGSRPSKVAYIEGDTAYSSYTFPTYEKLKNSIKENDIISIDIFDTLIMRKSLSPDDIFRQIERELSEKYDINLSFAEMRIESENISFKESNGAYSIDSIYHNMQNHFSLSHDITTLFKKVELATELENIVPRSIMVDAMHYAKNLQKKVILTSDIYLPGTFVRKLLFACNIFDNDYDKLFISCEVNKTKYNGDLWDYYKELYRDKTILHIGDNDFIDITQANNHGLNTFKTPSAVELFYISSLNGFRDSIRTLDDRLLMGKIVARLFNNPFVFSSSNKLEIDNAFTAGYTFLGPLILKFMIWLATLSSELKLNKILFLSRDGYILEKLYAKYLNYHPELNGTRGIYFLASRRALSVSSIRTEKDIIDVCRLAPYVTKITFNQFLLAAFGINTHKDDRLENCFLHDTNIDEIISHILDEYTMDILNVASDERKYYHDYCNTLNIKDSDKIGVINFVSSGFTQHFFEKLFPNPNTNFIYFMTRVVFEDIETHNDIYSLYEKSFSAYTADGNSLIKYYLTAESIFTSPEEQFVRFSTEGLPVYEDCNGHREYQYIDEFHKGIECFFNDNINVENKNLKRDYSIEFIDSLFGCLFSNDRCMLSQNLKNIFNISDNFSPDKTVKTMAD